MKTHVITIAAATAITLASTATPASALTVTVGGQPVASDHDIVSALVKAVTTINVNGATLTAGDYSVVFDPRVLDQEHGVASPEPIAPVLIQRGQTADGRTVVTPASGRISSGFGPRWGRMHQGIDIANDFGTPIYAVMDGTVVNAGPAQGYGNWVVIRHDNGEESVYGHMATYSVSVGQRVAAGDQIATIGSEGQSTGPHLHFEIKPDGSTPVDPQEWLRQQGIII
ncbi:MULTISPECIES: M23 family metallopeptidase [unclassified Corynebacterium]|uniref:M23 family metallopeptidase n=1 Tax=unclassified Corynebacterium TaxID=2624378 RepID=UPI002A90E474|nr:M23 family metallopeptidase [Corynebacterium sp.]MDY5784484.1 M23 family metallopeptidase [Corynebacterium sp.]